MALSQPSLTTLPTPTHLTLLFKHHKSTTVLSVLPSQTLAEVKSLLLQVLQSRDLTTFPGTPIPLPSKADDLELAITRDRRDGRDASRGWVNVEDAQALAGATANHLKSGKSRKSSSKVESNGQVEIVADLELKDASYIAYRLKRSVESLVDEDVDGSVVEGGKDEWSVILPSYEEDEEGAVPTVEHDGMEDDEDEDMDIPVPVPRNNITR